jgi:hypothetical protein
METLYKAIAILQNDAGNVKVEWADVSFKTLAEGKAWIDGEEGDLFAQSFNDEMKDGEVYEGYWLDDILVA